MAATEKLGPWEPGGGDLALPWQRKAPAPLPDDTAHVLAERVQSMYRFCDLSAFVPDDNDLVKFTPGAVKGIEAFYERFRDWWRRLRLSDAGEKALDAFDRVRLRPQRRTPESVQADLVTLFWVARACYLAATWPDRDTKPPRRGRGLERLRRAYEQGARYSEHLAKWLSKYGHDEWLGAVRVQVASAFVEHRPPGDLPRRGEALTLPADGRIVADLLPADLTHGLSVLAQRIRRRCASPASHELLWFGNLRLPRRRRGMNQVPDLATMLAFELVFHLRRWSSGRALEGFGPSDAMPTSGKPHYRVAAAFVRAALPGSKFDRGALAWVADTLARRIAELPAGVRLFPWPHDAYVFIFGVCRPPIEIVTHSR